MICNFVNNNGINFKLISNNGKVGIESPDLTREQSRELDSYLWDVTNRHSEGANLKIEDFDLLNNYNINDGNNYQDSDEDINVDDIDMSQYENMSMDEFMNQMMASKDNKRLLKKRP